EYTINWKSGSFDEAALDSFLQNLSLAAGQSPLTINLPKCSSIRDIERFLSEFVVNVVKGMSHLEMTIRCI
ncbi:hypothetical protein PFISCL1PPCAC_21652, partial [Pristionchus fissidentatus]